jgi:hypothetical protein
MGDIMPFPSLGIHTLSLEVFILWRSCFARRPEPISIFITNMYEIMYITRDMAAEVAE